MLELSELTVDVLIVGAGLAGLTCARQLQAEGVSCLVLEAADAVGGRIRTDQVDGYLLDRGFQVFLSSYPEPKRWLDLERLQLKRFASGARVRYRGRFYDLADPWRRPWTALGSLVSPIGTLTDKLRIARLRSISKRGSYEERMQDPEVTSHEYLKQLGFSRSMIDNFLRPFLGGIFLDRELNTSSRMLNFVFRMFSTGDACLPANGMQSIPEQLASSLWPGTIRLNAPVAEIRPRSVTLQSGEKLMAFRIVVATEAPTAKRLLSMSGETKGRGVRCLYFAAEQAPFTEPILVLNGDGLGPINNLCVPSNVCASYAPPKQSLISVTSMDCTTSESQLELQVRDQLRDWYGNQVDGWRHLRTYHIPYALPDQAPPALTPPNRSVDLGNGLFVCGDHRDNASIEGAMVSGRRAGMHCSGVAADSIGEPRA